MRGIDILAADLLRTTLDLGFKFAPKLSDQFGIASRNRLLQVLVVFTREFRVDWQQDPARRQQGI